MMAPVTGQVKLEMYFESCKVYTRVYSMLLDHVHIRWGWYPNSESWPSAIPSTKIRCRERRHQWAPNTILFQHQNVIEIYGKLLHSDITIITEIECVVRIKKKFNKNWKLFTSNNWVNLSKMVARLQMKEASRDILIFDVLSI